MRNVAFAVMWRSGSVAAEYNGIRFGNATLQTGYRARKKSVNAGWSRQRLCGLPSSATAHLANALAFISSFWESVQTFEYGRISSFKLGGPTSIGQLVMWRSKTGSHSWTLLLVPSATLRRRPHYASGSRTRTHAFACNAFCSF